MCVIAGALDLIKNTFDLSTLEEELVVSSVLAGAVVGSLVGGFQAEARGRKPAIVAFTVLFAAGALVMALAPSFAVLILGRVLVGIAVGGSGMSVVRCWRPFGVAASALSVSAADPPRPRSPCTWRN